MAYLTQSVVWLVELTPWVRLPLIAVISYLLGSINTSILVSRWAYRKDIRDYGSGNAGFTNAVRTMGWRRGLIVFVGDAAKCALAVLIGQLLYTGSLDFVEGAAGRLLAGAFVSFGHLYPLYFRFRGGKGVVTTEIAIMMFDWRIGLIVMGVFFLVVLLTRYISLGSLCGAVAIPVLVYVFSANTPGDIRMGWGYTALSAIVCLVVIIKHRTNIVRLWKGTESRFAFREKGELDEEKAP